MGSANIRALLSFNAQRWVLPVVETIKSAFDGPDSKFTSLMWLVCLHTSTQNDA